MEDLYKIFVLIFLAQNLIFSRGNLVGDDHPFPAISNVEVVLACSAPSSITLVANEQCMDYSQCVNCIHIICPFI